MSIRRRPNYSAAEVEGLIESYAELREKRGTFRGGLVVTVKLADLDRAVARLNRTNREVVLLHGLMGLPTRAVAEVLQKSHAWVAKKYRLALEEVVYNINGGTY